MTSPNSEPQSPNQTAFPTYFRRERHPTNLTDHTELSNRNPAFYNELPTTLSMTSNNAYSRLNSLPTASPVDENDQVIYAPVPEKRRLGYMSTAALIINRIIGTGIYSMPGSVLTSVGSKGGALMLWVGGAIITLSSLFVYLEFGLALPFNGGELVYLEKSWPRPRYLVVCVFSIFFVFLANTSANSNVFATHMILAFEPDSPPDPRLQKFVALVCATSVCLIHLFSRKIGIFVNNFLAIYKVLLLTFVVVAGFACMAGARASAPTPDEQGERYGVANLENAFDGSNESPHDYASAMLGVLFSYQGWENANYVLAEVKRPQGNESKTFKMAVLVTFALVSTLYILANVAYFAAIPTEDLMRETTNVAAEFLFRVFGRSEFVKRCFRVLLALSSFGNIIAVTYANSRVKQEVAKRRLIPFSKYWARNSPYGTPVGALTLHWIFTAVVIIATPNFSGTDDGYVLQSRVFTYGHTLAGVLISIGILILSRRPKFNFIPQVVSHPVLVILAISSVILNLFIIVLIWWPTATTNIPWIVTPATATAAIGIGFVYWFGFAKLLPAMGWKVEVSEEELVDGSRVVKYKRYKMGFARKLEDWRKGKKYPNSENENMMERIR